MALEKFSYDDKTPRLFLAATIVWGVVGMLVGLILALQLAFPVLNIEWLTFGRLRPLHTNAVIFAFAGNAFFTGCYYSMQRLLKTRTFSDALSAVHFWGWQLIIVGAAVTLPLGITQSKEYAELEWPLDLAVVLVWVAFAVNVFGTIYRRRERHIYVAIWFYIASIITVAILYIFNNLAVPAEAFRSYSVYAGVQDAFMQWWYGHNAVAFFLTTPFLGLMYYFLPKAANRPVFSYRLSILHFWSLVFIYIWAGPHHLHYTALPEWASTLGMLFSLMLWMPSWGGMINGLLTLRGAWHKVAADPVLKFFVVGVTFYGMSTFEGPMLSIKSVNALSHYTDWGIAHVHSGALGWVGFMTFGTVYWMAPRVFQTKQLWSRGLCEAHVWLGTIGILLYIVPLYVAGLTQGLMWREVTDAGGLANGDFVETVLAIMPMYYLRALGGTLYLLGTIICGVNLLMTWAARPRPYDVPVYEHAPLSPDWTPDPVAKGPLEEKGVPVLDAAYKLERLVGANWHRNWEGLPFKFTVWVTISVVVASLGEVIPTFLIKSNVPSISTVRPYTPLEQLGRDVYVSEGCYNCHSQMVRPIASETLRYGEYSKPGEFVYDHPFQWGSRRIGPDLHRVGGKYQHSWHVLHFRNPQETSQGSIMPVYGFLFETATPFDSAPARLRALSRVGVPYSEEEITGAADAARTQAKRLTSEILAQLPDANQIKDEDGKVLRTVELENQQVVALIAYLQRLGTDIKPPQSTEAGATAAPGARPQEGK
ncbi:MAG: cytochrome-c oxidase, cbb3-type subunit I [Planctomycetota bacterium]